MAAMRQLVGATAEATASPGQHRLLPPAGTPCFSHHPFQCNISGIEVLLTYRVNGLYHNTQSSPTREHSTQPCHVANTPAYVIRDTLALVTAPNIVWHKYERDKENNRNSNSVSVSQVI